MFDLREMLLALVTIAAVSQAVTPPRKVQSWFFSGFRDDSIVFPSGLISPFDTRIVLSNAADRQLYQQAVEALFGVAVRLKSLLDFTNTSGGNFLVSPLSVAVTLGQLLLGARGESRRRLSEMLSNASPKNDQPVPIPDLDFHQQLKMLLKILEGRVPQHNKHQYVLKVASAFFIQPNLNLKLEYRHAIMDLYQSDVVHLNFSSDPVGSQRFVNQWATTHTDGHINTVLPYPLPPNTASLIANAIYFRGAWENPFDESLTIPGTFKMSPSKRVAVYYMRGHFELNYVESERLGCQLVVLPYKKNQAAMYVLLPFEKGSDIRNFTATLNVNDIAELLQSAKMQSVTLVFPRMSLTGSFSLREPLARFEKLQNNRGSSESMPHRPHTRSRHWVVKRDKSGFGTTNQRREQNVISGTEVPCQDNASNNTIVSETNVVADVQKTTYTVTNVNQEIEHNVISEPQNIFTNNTENRSVANESKETQTTLGQSSLAVMDDISAAQNIDQVNIVETILEKQKETNMSDSETVHHMTQKSVFNGNFSASNVGTVVQNTVILMQESVSKVNEWERKPLNENTEVVESTTFSGSTAPVIMLDINNVDNHSEDTSKNIMDVPMKQEHGQKSNSKELHKGEFQTITTHGQNPLSQLVSENHPTTVLNTNKVSKTYKPEYEDKGTFIDLVKESENSYAVNFSAIMNNAPKEPCSMPKHKETLPQTFSVSQFISGSSFGNAERPIHLHAKPSEHSEPGEENLDYLGSMKLLETTFNSSTQSTSKPIIPIMLVENIPKPVVAISTSSKESQPEASNASQLGKPSIEKPTEHPPVRESQITSESDKPPVFKPLSVNGPFIPLPTLATPKPHANNRVQFDMTGASEDIRFQINDILHHMWLEVNEKGTESAAVSAGTVDYSGDIKLMLVDRPFLFYIRHEATLATLFWGTIVDPTGGSGLVTEDVLARLPQGGPKSSLMHRG